MTATPDVWERLAAPLPADVVQWRQQGKPKARDGKFFALFVAYIDAQFVRDRLDATVPGEWSLRLELLPPAVTTDGEEVEPFSFKAQLQVLGVVRECVGSGKDYKTAATDAFKRAAVRFGIGRELYTDFELLWVQVDGDGKYAKAVEDPAQVYAKKHGSNGAKGRAGDVVSTRQRRASAASAPPATIPDGTAPASPAPTITGAARKHMPFGKQKGKELGELSSDELRKTVAWCREKGKFDDLVDACNEVLALRQDDTAFPQVLQDPVNDGLPF